MISKEDILAEIRRTAHENNGQPLGGTRFERETGITAYEWGRYWARFSDAQREAGLTPNQLQGPHADAVVFNKLTQLTRKLRRFPTYREIDAERINDSGLPTKKVFQRYGSKKQLAQKLLTHCQGKAGMTDIAEFCRQVIEASPSSPPTQEYGSQIGEVYLIKSGKFYKIGRSGDTVRRGRELKIQLPQKMELIHSIKTDDPSGVEAYWHKRFDTKRMQGEWFDLKPGDVSAFRRWKRIH